MSSDALLEIAQHLASLSASEIRLHAGEMTAQEMRAVKAVLRWQATELRQRAMGSDTDKVTRVEIVDETGRVWSKWNLTDVRLSFQDAGRTLKIFCKNENSDFAAAFRRDLKAGLPPTMVIDAAQRHVAALQDLPNDAPYRDKALADMEAFLAEKHSWRT